MAAWTQPPATVLTGSTKVKDTDDRINDAMSDLENWVNGVAPYSALDGLASNYVTEGTTQTITGAKTFSLAITASAGLVGDVTGNVSGNAGTATALATSRTFSLTGDVTATGVGFDGTGNVTLTTAVADDSHNHIIGNVDGLQTELDAKASTDSPTFTGTPTAPTQAAIDNSTKLATTAYVTSAIADGDTMTSTGASITSNGYQKFSNGLIMQWGLSGTVPSNGSLVEAFPIPFPTACLHVQTTCTVDTDVPITVNGFTVNNVTLRNSAQATTYNNEVAQSAYWFAIGY